MLVLSRKVGEELVIDDSIRVQVLESRGNRIRLGIVAPREVAVVRGEIAAQEHMAVPARRAAAGERVSAVAVPSMLR